MSHDSVNLLLVDEVETNYYKVKKLLNQITHTQFNLEWVCNLDQASVAKTFQNYDAYLFNSQVGKFTDWCFQVNPTPVILITENSSVGIKALEEGISDYILEDDLSSFLLEHSLRLSIAHSRTKTQLQQCQLDYQAQRKQDKETNKNQTTELLHTIFDPTLAELLPVGIFQNDAEGNCVYINQKISEMLDLTFEECLGHGWVNRLHPDDKEKILQSWNQAFATKSYWEDEYRFLHPDGKIVWVLANCIFTFNEQGENTGSIGGLMDITSKKELEQALEESQTLFQDLAANVPGAIFSYRQYPDGSNKVKFMSKGCEELWEVSAEAVANDSTMLWEMIHPDYLHRMQESINVSAQNLSDWSFDFPITTPSGKEKWLQAVGKPRPGENNAVIWNSLIIDVTESKLAEEKIRINQARLKMALDVANMTFWQTNLKTGEIESWGKHLANQWYGQKPHTQTIDIAIHPDDNIKIRQVTEEAIATLGDYQIEYRRIFANQEPVWYLTKGRVLSDEGGNPVQIMGVTLDINKEKQAEETLRTSEIRYRNLVETLPGIVYSFSSQQGDYYVSRRIESILGYQVSELQANPWRRNHSIHPDDINIVNQAIKNCAKGEKFAIEYRIQDKQGKWHWFYDYCINSRIDDGEIIIDGLALDITERKQMEIALKTSEFNLKEAQSIAKLGSWIYDLKTGFCHWSEEVYHIFGKDSQQFVPSYESFLERTHVDDRALVRNNIKQVFSFPEKYKLNYRIALDDGQIKYIEENADVILDENGKLLGLRGIVQDLTETKKQEEALRESEARFRSVFEQAAVGIAIASSNGRLHTFNDKFASFFCYSPSELVNVHFQDITYPDDLVTSLNCIQEILTGKIDSFSIDKRYLTKNSQIKWGNLTCTLHRDAQGDPQYFILILDDIDSRKKAEIMLEQAKNAAEEANEAKSLFLANISHELRTPLNSILGFTQLMNLYDELSAQNKEYISIINKAGEHLLSLVNDILDLAKIESGQITLNVECFDLYYLLDSLKEIFALKTAEKNLELLSTRKPNVPQYIKTDKAKLRSVIINLISNSIKFTHQGNIHLQVSCEEIESKVNLIFELNDTGVGISPEELSNLFRVFVQTKSGKKSGEGTGLGLAISKRFVNLMNGDIKVSSKLNQGSTFTFNIICELGEVVEIQRSNSTQNKVVVGLKANQPQYRILIAEDNNANRELLKHLLEGKGFLIREAINGQEAVNLWQQWQPDLILMDIRMPVINGYQAIREIRQREAEENKSPVKIIAFTASVFESDKQYLLSLGCDDFIVKPLKITELWQKLATNLGVEWEYQDQVKTNSMFLSNLPQKLKPEDLSFMGYEWRERLHYAVLSARKQKILAIINEIPPEKDSIIRSLEFLVNQLHFEKVMALTNVDEISSGNQI